MGGLHNPDPFAEPGAEARTWTFASCLACRQMAVVAPNGMAMCPTCDARALELQRLLASVARPPVFGALRSALRAGTTLSQPQAVPAA